VKKTSSWIKILIAVLVIGNLVGWTIFSQQRDQIKEHEQQVEDLRWEIGHLQSRIDAVEEERNQLFDDVRILSQKPFDVSSIAEPRRSHTVVDVFNSYQFWNTGQDIDEFFDNLHLNTGLVTWLFEDLLGESWDVSEFASLIWDGLNGAGIISVIVIGNLDLDNAKFSESNHAWLLVFYEDISSNENTIFILEPLKRTIASIPVEKELPLKRDTEREIDYMSGHGVSSLWVGGEEYLQGYIYISSLDLEADIKER